MKSMMSLRLKKLHFVLLFGLVFLIWNFLTYYTLSQNRTAPGEREASLLKRLQQMQQELAKQQDDNKKLLTDLQAWKKPEAGPVLQKPVGGDSKAAQPEAHLPSGETSGVIPVLMIACDRITVNRALDKLLEFRPNATKFPIIVSQDCGHTATAEVIHKYVVSHNITHIKQPDLSNIVLPSNKKKWVGYYKIARHYKWALDQIFITFGFPAVIIVEDDLDISPDFYEYFSATYPLLKHDEALWCVSAWNDNGKTGMVSGESELLYRTDFFPGLGWMIERKLWVDELQKKWPDTFWDDWMRHPDQRKGRECIRPEICRTSTFGKKGVSKGLYFEKHLKFIQHNTKFVPFSKMDLSYLLKENYDPMFTKQVYSAPLLTPEQVKSGAKSEEKVVRVEYNGKDSFKKLAKSLGIMDDFKAGVPRVAYKGVVSFMLNGRRIFLAPPPDWKGYNTSWS